MSLRYKSVFDRETAKERANFSASIRLEKEFARHLRQIADKVGHIVEMFDPLDPTQMKQAEHMLMQYSELIRPWATAASRRMLTEASRRDAGQWEKISKKLSKGMRQTTMSGGPTGKLLRMLLGEQVALIQSIPLDAARRVHEYTLRGLESGARAAEIADQIRRTADVSRSSAMRIARTEVARTSSLLTQSRATQIGSEGYVWRTSKDQDVRLAHKKMEGKFVRWDTPPTLTDGTTTHAGQIYNCRCWPEPVIPDDL